MAEVVFCGDVEGLGGRGGGTEPQRVGGVVVGTLAPSVIPCSRTRPIPLPGGSGLASWQSCRPDPGGVGPVVPFQGRRTTLIPIPLSEGALTMALVPGSVPPPTGASASDTKVE